MRLSTSRSDAGARVKAPQEKVWSQAQVQLGITVGFVGASVYQQQYSVFTCMERLMLCRDRKNVWFSRDILYPVGLMKRLEVRWRAEVFVGVEMRVRWD